MQAWHQKNDLEPYFPFGLGISCNLEFPPHWHEEIEVLYEMEGGLQVGLNNETYEIAPRDIFLIGAGDVHYFSPRDQCTRTVVIQFSLSFFDSFSTVMGDRRFVRPLLGCSRKLGIEDESSAHSIMERHILEMVREYREEQKGYQMVLKARLYDLIVTLLRRVPMKSYSSRERSRQLNRLERLEKVFKYVQEHYDSDITLEEIARVANFSTYHFTRFFKEATGMTFNSYLNDFRIRRAEWYLLNMDIPVTEIAYMAGFNSIKTFNRVFKRTKDCSPSEYRRKGL